MKSLKTNRALHLASRALNWTDASIRKFTSLESLPEPLDCKPGCHYCCYNLPMVTPPEVLIIGHHVESSFSGREKQALTDRIEKILERTDDKKPDEIAMMRHELPCIFLKEGMCMVYLVRPVVCRTCSSISAAHCKAIFESGNHRASLRCYHHIREIFHAVQNNLVNKCQEMGFQSDLLYIAEGLRDYFKHPSPIEAWLQGKMVFRIRNP
ncbi:MAG: YkgJ family cysteine cluster protein [Pseudomonadota bacterium]